MLQARRALASASRHARRFAAGPKPMTTAAAPAGRRSFATHPNEDILSGSSGTYMEGMFKAWKENPASVHKSWDVYFRNVEAGRAPGVAFQSPPGTTSAGRDLPAGAAVSASDDIQGIINDHLKVQSLVRGYQSRGHNIAALDPLSINDADLDDSVPPELDYKNYGFTEADLDRTFTIGHVLNKGFIDSDNPKPWTLRELLKNLERTYCNHVGFEYMHIYDREKCNFIRERIETPTFFDMTKDQKLIVLDRLIRSHEFEHFLATKWSAEKRFGLEGCEVLVPAMKHLIDAAADVGCESVVIGMPHRGRLNVLANVIRKPLAHMFGDFAGVQDPGSTEGSGDVKYHFGMSHDRVTLNGKSVHLSLVANPSHLEAVNPVVAGKTRAEQFYKNDTKREKVIPVLMHGDAAFSGQGVVFETLGLSDLPSYTVGGTIHIVVNNQIGFTTDPRFSRSTPYCTDVAKTVGAPIFHVNGDDPEAVIKVVQLAVEWRHRYKKDVVIDLVCYRRHGHNEIDQAGFTQPLMYKHISKHAPTLDIYAAKLIAEGVITQAELDERVREYRDLCQHEYEVSKDTTVRPQDWLESKWEGFKGRSKLAEIQDTGVSPELLKHMGEVISTYPADFNIHKGLSKIMKARGKAVTEDTGLDWACGEAFAFGSLLLEGNHVRLSGQDVERGTFSHRHHVLHDQNTEDVYVQLNHLDPDQAVYSVSNSSLSEYGVLGFELGYSMTNPNSLVLWEAQFGDFCNTAQTIIDQFISCGEDKWLRQSGITLLLPHGYEGQGPEHSSGRLERFLQSSNDDPHVVPEMSHDHRQQIQNANWQVLNCTTPANYFHALRRQIHRDFRKPLIIMTPKSLLRHPHAKSPLADFGPGTRFKRLIPETDPTISATPAEQVRRVIFCSGKVYYDLLKEREDRGITDVAIARVEQIGPFPFDLCAKQMDKYPNADVTWCQEEPKNMGAYSYVEPRIETALRELSAHHAGKRARYAGRPPSASTATGFKKTHVAEVANLLAAAYA